MHTSAASWLQLHSHRWNPLSSPHMAYRPQGAMVSWATSLEMLRMMAMPAWGGLQTVLKEEKATTWRRILTHHTSQSCPPRKEGGVVESLAGLDTVQRSRIPAFSQNPVYQVRVQLDFLFEPDDTHLPASGIPPLVCCSTEESTLVLAQENVCLEIFTFLLAIAPQKVYVASASMRNIERVRAAAQEFHDSLDVPRWGTWAAFYFGDTRRTDKPLAGRNKMPTFVRKSDPTIQATRDEELVNLMQAPWENKPAFFDPSRLPSRWWKGIAECIPKNGLKPWLKRHPDIFEVHELAGGGPWTFSIKANEQVGGLPTSGAASSGGSGAASSGGAAATTVSQLQSHAPAAAGTATSTSQWQQGDGGWQGWQWSGTVASTTTDSVGVGSLPASGAADPVQGGPQPQWSQSNQCQGWQGWQLWQGL